MVCSRRVADCSTSRKRRQRRGASTIFGLSDAATCIIRSRGVYFRFGATTRRGRSSPLRSRQPLLDRPRHVRSCPQREMHPIACLQLTTPKRPCYSDAHTYAQDLIAEISSIANTLHASTTRLHQRHRRGCRGQPPHGEPRPARQGTYARGTRAASTPSPRRWATRLPWWHAGWSPSAASRWAWW